MKNQVDDRDIIFKIITHKKCKVKNIGNKTRVLVDSMILEMPTKLSDKLINLNKTKRYRVLKNMISNYLHIIDKNF